LKNFHTPAQQQFSSSAAGSRLAAYASDQFDKALSWEHITWLQSLTRLPILIKGVVHPDDARLAVEHGCAGVIVSNHGGRQLDTTAAPIDALPRIAEVIDRRALVLLDGGVRRGTDMLKALALGADAVAVGRPVLWGLAVNGESGVRHVLTLLHDEFRLAMQLCGCRSVDEITRDLVVRAPL
jgi:4-hydroxymandelate oxidase